MDRKTLTAAALVILATVAGCAPVGQMGLSRSYVGIIERVHPITRIDEPSEIPYAFRVLTSFVYPAFDEPMKLNMYFVRTADNKMVTVELREAWPMGACVEVVPTTGAMGGTAFIYNFANLEPSNQCVPFAPGTRR